MRNETVATVKPDILRTFRIHTVHKSWKIFFWERCLAWRLASKLWACKATRSFLSLGALRSKVKEFPIAAQLFEFTLEKIGWFQNASKSQWVFQTAVLLSLPASKHRRSCTSGQNQTFHKLWSGTLPNMERNYLINLYNSKIYIYGLASLDRFGSFCMKLLIYIYIHISIYVYHTWSYHWFHEGDMAAFLIGINLSAESQKRWLVCTSRQTSCVSGLNSRQTSTPQSWKMATQTPPPQVWGRPFGRVGSEEVVGGVLWDLFFGLRGYKNRPRNMRRNVHEDRNEDSSTTVLKTHMVADTLKHMGTFIICTQKSFPLLHSCLSSLFKIGWFQNVWNFIISMGFSNCRSAVFAGLQASTIMYLRAKSNLS